MCIRDRGRPLDLVPSPADPRDLYGELLALAPAARLAA
jgi:hypothetical protein